MRQKQRSMSITNLITAAEVVSIAVKKTAYDTAKMEGNIPLAQLKYLKPFLGLDFYNELVSQAPSSYTPDNQILVDVYLKKALAYFVVYETFWENQVKETNKGNVMNQGEFISQPEDTKLEMKWRDYLSKGNSWLSFTQEYIEEQQDADSSKFANYSKGVSDEAKNSTSTVFIPE